MALWYAFRSRGLTKDIRIKGGPNGYILPGASDKLRAIIQQKGVTFLTVTSDAPTAAGSSFTKSGGEGGDTNNRLRLDATDLDIAPGTYTLVIDYFDGNDANEWKHVDSQVFQVEEASGILDVSSVLLELGLGNSASEAQRATAYMALKRAEAAIIRGLRYDPKFASRTEYYPQADYTAKATQGLWETTADVAHFRRIAPGAGDVLMVRHLPVRSDPLPIVYIDYDGRSGSRSGSFGSGTQRTHGTDFWPNYDGVDSEGNKYCSDGIIRSLGLWPAEPGAVKIVYSSGYTAEELAGTDPNLDASPIAQAVLVEAVLRARRALSRSGAGRAGFVAGPLTSESLGDYSYSMGGADKGMTYGSLSLSMEAMEMIRDFINYGYDLAG